MFWLIIACLLDWTIIVWTFWIESFGKDVRLVKFIIESIRIRIYVLENVIKCYKDRVERLQEMIENNKF